MVLCGLYETSLHVDFVETLHVVPGKPGVVPYGLYECSCGVLRGSLCVTEYSLATIFHER